ncbi:hypothetical protein L5515_016846 [Caenorhabditis briggsae]|uniref:Major sperm protein n=1 Tax=Caenorhabditis briggsae TaxID=6238 RepID=A0AAE9F743_CAEBR|nr:hypothetical protein L5515_016846 [Caenorhabditis briggsae]
MGTVWIHVLGLRTYSSLSVSWEKARPTYTVANLSELDRVIITSNRKIRLANSSQMKMDSGDNREIEKNDESRDPTSSSGPLTSSKEDFFAALAAQNQDLINQMLSSCLSNPVPNKTSSFDKWKKKVLKNQENNPEYGPKEIATFPSQCLAITRSIGCQNFVHFGIKNNSNTPIKYSVNLTNQFLEIVGNSEGVVDIGCTVRVPILCKFDSHAPVDDELILKFGESEKIFTRSFPIFYDPKVWSFCIFP